MPDDRRAEVDADDVDGGGEGDRRGRQRPRRQVVRHRIDAEGAEGVLAEDHGDPAERRRADQDQLRPAEEEAGEAAPALAKVRVEPAGFRQRGGELGERERAAQRDDAAHRIQTRASARDSARGARCRRASGRCPSRS